jgi:hypothetical protein
MVSNSSADGASEAVMHRFRMPEDDADRVRSSWAMSAVICRRNMVERASSAFI